ncbi:hypothetical protein ACLOJK_037863 [Asimina triloba]
MGHHSCCNKQKVRRGLWSPEEDEKLINYISTYGHGCWSSVPRQAGLQRCGKSCRLRWINYLRPDLKRGSFSPQEESLIIKLHGVLGNRWAQIAKHLPGRTDNEVKNFFNSTIKKKLISHGAAADVAVPDGSSQVASDGNFLSQNSNPGLVVPSKDHALISATASTPHVLGHEELKMDVINYNVDWFIPPLLSPPPFDTPCNDPSWPLDHHHRHHRHNHRPRHHREEDYECPNLGGNEAASFNHTQAKFLDAKFILPCDHPSAVSQSSMEVPRFCETAEGDECSFLSSSLSHEIEPWAGLPCFPFGTYPYDPQVTIDYMDATMASSSSFPCGHYSMNPVLPPNWVP